MKDGFPLINELYQLQPLSPVEVVHPNYPQGEQMLLQMKKNIVVYLSNYLVEESKMDKGFVKELLEASCDTDLVTTAKGCD